MKVNDTVKDVCSNIIVYNGEVKSDTYIHIVTARHKMLCGCMVS